MSNPELTFPQAVINFPAQDEPLIRLCKNVHDAIVANPSLTNPDPTMAVFLVDITAYDLAQSKVGTGGKPATKLRNAKRKKVKADLHHLRDYIQGMAELADSPADATALITSVFLGIKKPGKHAKPELAAKNVSPPGRVFLDAKAVAATATYFWEYSTDQKTWISVQETMQSRTYIDGLTVATTYYFRFRARTRKEAKGYSMVVPLLVH